MPADYSRFDSSFLKEALVAGDSSQTSLGKPPEMASPPNLENTHCPHVSDTLKQPQLLESLPSMTTESTHVRIVISLTPSLICDSEPPLSSWWYIPTWRHSSWDHRDKSNALIELSRESLPVNCWISCAIIILSVSSCSQDFYLDGMQLQTHWRPMTLAIYR